MRSILEPAWLRAFKKEKRKSGCRQWKINKKQEADVDNTERRVLVIGGGAAGMMAALTAAERGCSVTLLEKNEKLGKKIYITGKGRCNYTNACDFNTFIGNVVSNPKFMYSSLRAFMPEDVTELLEEAGCSAG